MKKRLFFILVLSTLLCFSSALADEAQDISSQVSFDAKSNARLLHRLSDRSYKSVWTSEQNRDALEIVSPTPMYGLYISWEKEPKDLSIERYANGIWEIVAEYSQSSIVHQYYPLDEEYHVRIRPHKNSSKNLAIQEIYVLGKGTVPSWVQLWQPSYEDADMMLLFAHPDDEVLFFGGLLPYYAKERGLRVLPVLFTDAGALRRSELLDSLWSLGVSHYPVLSSFADRYAWKLEEAYNKYGKAKSTQFVVEQIRKYKPEVIISHDIDGEYGHGVHRLCADLAMRSILYTNDPDYHTSSYEQYGGFEVQKVYLHLYKENPVVMDWDQPLLSFRGKTGFELAFDAYENFHLSQHRYEQYEVEPRNSEYSCYEFGLYYSAVGPDILKDDFMENVSLQ